jgi:hypothetical protein
MVFSTMEKNWSIVGARYVRLAIHVKMDSMMHYWEKLGSIAVANVDRVTPASTAFKIRGKPASIAEVIRVLLAVSCAGTVS